MQRETPRSSLAPSGRSSRTRGAALLGLVLLLSCGQPPRTLEQIYADRPVLRDLDTSALVGRRILIDPGHGGFFAGSRGVADTREADVNLGVGLYLWGLLHDAGADVHLTRASDRDLLPAGSQAVGDDLAGRVALLDSLQPEVFLSLHHNSNAELDRERNAIETYYKLDDEGPSYDLARAVHRSLASSLGIVPASLRPGNYYVLRESRTAAVLGEASYLSHPDVESRLQLAEKQLLEAEAYFLGLLDYFGRGVPQLVWPTSTGDTLTARDVLHLGLRADTRSRIDPLSLRVRVDARPVTVLLDDSLSSVAVPLQDLSPGTHRIDVHVRNLRGNAAPPLSRHFVVWAPPSHLRLRLDPAIVPAGGDANVRLTVLGPDGEPIGDGIGVSLQGVGCSIDTLETRTRSGHVLARLRHVQPRATLRATVMDIDTTWTLSVDTGVPAARVPRVVDARDGTPLSDAWVRLGGTLPRRTDRAGLCVLRGDGDSLHVQRRGYVPRRAAFTHTLPMTPLFEGVLLDVPVVLDPFGSGLEPTDPLHGVSGPQRAYDVVAALATGLEATGAIVHLTRGPSEDVPELERVRLAARTAARLYLRIEVTLDPSATAEVLHYPQSRTGAALAAGIAAALRRRDIADSVRVAEDTQTILQQTPCPAVVVRLPGLRRDRSDAPPAPATRARPFAYALQLGLRRGLSARPSASLEGRITVTPPAVLPELVLLDGAELLQPGPDGRFRFDAVPAGPHELTFHGGARIWRRWVVVADSVDTSLVVPLR